MHSGKISSTKSAVKKKQRGMSLLEIIIVAGIIGIIYSGVAILINRAMDNYNATKIIQNASAIQLAMMQVYKSRGLYPDVGDNAKKSQEIEENLITLDRLTHADFVHTFGGKTGKLTIQTSRYRGRNNAAFVILLDDLTAPQCRIIINNSVDLFPFVEVVVSGGAKSGDIYARQQGDTGLGVLRSPAVDDGTRFDSSNLQHISRLCPNDDSLYDVYLGNH